MQRELAIFHDFEVARPVLLAIGFHFDAMRAARQMNGRGVWPTNFRPRRFRRQVGPMRSSRCRFRTRRLTLIGAERTWRKSRAQRSIVADCFDRRACVGNGIELDIEVA